VLDDTTDSMLFELEKNALKILHSRHPNIVPLLGSYKYKDKYNFIFPRADCDLDMYFQHGTPPQTPREMYDLFTEISKLVSALDTIHDCKITFDLDEGYDVSQIGYHRDLKPKNILKMGDIFMISDLGLAIFKEQGPVSNTEWILGESTYYAPECKANGKAGRLSDIWSLGCIFSEVVTFALRGATGIHEFWLKRKQSYVDGISLDYFYKDDTVCKGVLEWFDELRLYAEHDPFIVEILGLIEEMLTPAQRRPRANAVDEKFSRILEKERKRKGYEKPTPRAVFTDPGDPRNPRELRSPRKEFVISRDITEIPEQIQAYLPPTPPEPLSLPSDQPSPIQSIVSPMLSNLIQGNRSQSPERKHTLMVNSSQINGSDSGEERSSTPQGLCICNLDIQDSRYRDQPKTTGPPPLLYKVPGFVKKSLKGKNPFGYLKEFDTVSLTPLTSLSS
jgi:serine/threonine protein kinase